MSLLVNTIRLLPLRTVQKIGGAFGALTYACSARYRHCLKANMRAAGYDDPGLIHQASREVGQQMLESAWLWGHSDEDFSRLIVIDEASDRILSEHVHKHQPMIFLTPHIGNFELLPRWFAWAHLRGTDMNLTVMYRKPKLAWLEKLMVSGRQHDHVRLATADLAGVRRLIRSLRRGEHVGILPDQVPRKGEGVWAPFFGRWAYTVCLPARLAESTGADVLCVWTQRRPDAQGWELHVQPPIQGFNGDACHDAALMNGAIEDVIRRCPEQYLWGYNRYKKTGSMPPIPQS